jgi:S1-C subfamily serine protease
MSVVIPNFTHTGLASPITEFAVVLVARNHDQILSLGSGVIVGPSIALTARHVVEAFYNFLDKVSIEKTPLNHEAKFCLQAIQFLENGTKALMWDVGQIVMGQENSCTDIAVLKLNPTTQTHLDYKWRGLKVQLVPPSIGERISAFGYHSTNIHSAADEIKISVNPYTSNGLVEEVHEQKRDAFGLPFPCFRTNARFDGGMSGGPVFTANGYLCGLICSNIRPSTKEEANVPTSAQFGRSWVYL